MKVLLSAFSCCPGAGSEPGVGWNWVQQVSREHEVWLITSDEFRPQVKQALPPNVHASFVPSFQRWSRWKRTPLPGLDWLYYYWWQWKAYRLARALHQEVGFDLAHHVTFVTWRAPSFLCLLPIPFIWGPVGGGGTPPRSLWAELGWRGRLFEGIRGLCQFTPRWDPTIRLTLRRAARVLAANRETRELLPSAYQSKTQTMLGIGMSDTEAVQAVLPREKPGGFIILFVAHLQPIKGGTLAIKAMARLAAGNNDATLVMVGDGAERPRLSALAADLGISHRVRFLGKLPRAEVLGWMKTANVLLHPSLRDSGGMVLLEAMLQAKPVVCLDLGGPGEIVTAECGFKIQPTTPQQVVEELGNALLKLASDSSLCQMLGEAGRRRVKEHFDWDKRGARMMGIYNAC